MRFCSICQTMFRLSITPTGDETTEQLKYHCPKCGKSEDTSPDDLVISELNLSAKQEASSYLINEYTKYDPTLPRTTTVDCPNKECPSRADESIKEIVYIRYDDTNLKYMYLCCVCDTHWKYGK
jgi:DNA-directed RNA polymerase subunit M/transcription elongation factor TFIIS